MLPNYNQITDELNANSNAEKAQKLQSFFKTKKGQYGEGDVFIGINVPVIRAIAKKYSATAFEDVRKLVLSEIHEYRMCGFLILTCKYKLASSDNKPQIVDFYLANLDNCNNWDLVDLSSSKILGFYLVDKDKSVLFDLAQSRHLWRERVAIVSTYEFIRQGHFATTFQLSELLLHHSHDLIQKATGWMLREIGKRDKGAETQFLIKHYKTMPRTMLRYAIEKFPEPERQGYLKGIF